MKSTGSMFTSLQPMEGQVLVNGELVELALVEGTFVHGSSHTCVNQLTQNNAIIDSPEESISFLINGKLVFHIWVFF